MTISSVFSSYLKVLDAVIDAGREDPALRTAARFGYYLDDLLEGTAHSVEHGVFVDPCRLAVWMPQASLWKEFNVKCQICGLYYSCQLPLFFHDFF